MKILVDENIPRITVNRLLELGHDVRRSRPGERRDDRRPPAHHRASAHQGILIVRRRQPNRMKIHQSVLNAMARFAGAEWPGLLVVMRDSMMSTSRAGRPPVP